MNQIQTLLIIGFVWPEPNSSAAGGRMLQLIAQFQQQGYAITFASPAMDSDFMVDLASLNVDKKSIALNCTSFDVFVKELNPTVVLFDRFMIEEQFGWRVAENCPDALRILDTEDLLSSAYSKICRMLFPWLSAVVKPKCCLVLLLVIVSSHVQQPRDTEILRHRSPMTVFFTKFISPALHCRRQVVSVCLKKFDNFGT